MKCSGPCGSQPAFSLLPSETTEKTNLHPCYSSEAHRQFARMHLPVAPRCNISCNYCNRKFDCVNESRPGVTSEILSPQMALEKFLRVRKKIEELSVVGIAGPGDALANWEDTRKSIELIRDIDPGIVFCLSTNGLMLPDYAQEIIDLGIRHVTVTMNALDPEIGARIYKFITYRGNKYTGIKGARLLLENQLRGIQLLTSAGAAVKINIVMIKGINDGHIPAIVKKAKELDAFITNIMPLIPAPGSAFENYPQTSMKELNVMRDICEVDLHQMRHCKQCRADAIGLLEKDRAMEFRNSIEVEKNLSMPAESAKQYKIAVASKFGWLVDQHFGRVSKFAIYQQDGAEFYLAEKRRVDKYCTGVDECDIEQSKRDRIIGSLADCDAVLCLRIGYHAEKRLASRGIVSIETCDTIENGLRYAVKTLKENHGENFSKIV